MKAIKRFLIHLFGGVTEEESMESDNNSFDMGYCKAFCDMKGKMEDMHGKPAEEWTDEAWNYVIARMDFIENQY